MTGYKWWALLAFLSLGLAPSSHAADASSTKRLVRLCIPQPLDDQEVMAMSRKDRQIYVRRVHYALIPLHDMQNKLTASTPSEASARLRDLISKFSWIETVYADAGGAPVPPSEPEDLSRCDS